VLEQASWTLFMWGLLLTFIVVLLVTSVLRSNCIVTWTGPLKEHMVLS